MYHCKKGGVRPSAVGQQNFLEKLDYITGYQQSGPRCDSPWAVMGSARTHDGFCLPHSLCRALSKDALAAAYRNLRRIPNRQGK